MNKFERGQAPQPSSYERIEELYKDAKSYLLVDRPDEPVTIGLKGISAYKISHQPDEEVYIITDIDKELSHVLTPEGLVRIHTEKGAIDIQKEQQEASASDFVNEVIESVYQTA